MTDIKKSGGGAGDFTEGSIFGKLLRFMLPVLLALILQATYGAVDLLIIGQFGTSEGISGVSTGSGILMLVTCVITAIASAVTVLIGQYLGRGERERISRLIGGAVAFFFILSLVLTAILVLLAPDIARLMQAPPEALELTTDYIRICGGGLVFIVFYNLISSIFRGLGDSKMPLVFVGIACITNVIGDLVFVAGLGMNVAGAAIATVIAQAVSVVLSLILIKKRNLGFSVRLKDIRLSRETLACLKIGTPLALQEFLTSLSFLALCAFINRLGIDASNGYGIAQKLVSFILLIPAALLQSMSAFVAQNVGAGKDERARRGMYFGMLTGSVIGVAVAILIFFFGDAVAAVFTADGAAIVRAHEYLRGFAPEAAITCILFSFMGYFNGHGRSTFVMAQGLMQSFLIRLPVSYIMSVQPDPSLTSIGYAAPAATVFGIIICASYYLYLRRGGKYAIDTKQPK